MCCALRLFLRCNGRGHRLRRAAALGAILGATNGANAACIRDQARHRSCRFARPAPPPSPATRFGEEHDTDRKARSVYLKGTGTWDNAFETNSLIHSRPSKPTSIRKGLKVDGQPMTLFTSTDDTGFQFEVAIPLVELPKNPPRGDIAVGTSAGKAARSNSSIAGRMTDWTIPTRQSQLPRRAAAGSQGHVHRAIFDRSLGHQ